jgi:S1-C subfamily serine protease
MAVIPPFFLDCIVAIGFGNPDGTRRYAATGFLYGKFISQIEENSEYRIFLVTNRHVFENAQLAWLRFNTEGDEPAREFDLPLVDKNGVPAWLAHSDKEVDLAVIAINVNVLLENKIRFSFFMSDKHIMDREKALDLGLSEGDSIFVLGFPMGLIGGHKNFVIVRQGVIARIRDCLAKITKNFLIDTTIFPGNSGGPIVSRPEIVSIEGTKSINRAYLIGIVSNYVTYQDTAVSSQTQRARIVFEENSGLANVVPVDYLMEIIDAAIDVAKPEIPVEPSSNTPEAGSESDE